VRVFLLAPIAILALLNSCDACNRAPRPALVADAAPPPPAIANRDAPVPDRYAKDPLWQRVLSDDDDIDRAALADREGASGLLDAFEAGGPVARAALLTLPFADDARVAYGRLGEVALLTTDDARRDVVAAIFAIAANEPPCNEPQDPDGRKTCAQALLLVANNERVEQDVRATAVSALRLPAFRGMCDPAAIPSAFDPSP